MPDRFKVTKAEPQPVLDEEAAEIKLLPDKNGKYKFLLIFIFLIK